MKVYTAKDAMYGLGRQINLAHVEPVAVAKHGRPVVLLAIEKYERLKAAEAGAAAKAPVARRVRNERLVE